MFILTTYCFFSLRNPRLASLISHLSPDSINAPVAKSILDFESALLELKTKEPNQMVSEWTVGDFVITRYGLGPQVLIPEV